MALIQNWDASNNFWKLHPQFLTGGPIKEMYEADKSKGKEESSKIMWCIAIIYDNASVYSNWSIKDRVKFAENEILKKEGIITKSEYRPIINFYESLQDTPALRQLKEWERIMDEKSEMMRTMKYNLANWETIESMLTSNSKLYKELERIKMDLDKEGTGTRTKGGSEESLTEQGALDLTEDVSK